MAMDANAVGLISLNKEWYETDSYKDVHEIDILEDKKGEDPTRRLQLAGPDADGDEGLSPQTPDYYIAITMKS